MDDEVFVLGGIQYREVRPGVYEIPLAASGDLRIGQLLPHSSIDIVGLPIPPEDPEFYLSITNGGDENEDQYFTIFAGVYFASDDNRLFKLTRIRRAYLPLVEREELPEAFIPPSTRARPNRGASFSIDLGGRPEAVIRDELKPILQLYNRLSRPDRHVFICHASEDKPFARRVAAYLRQAGAEVWLDEWEIRVGDSNSGEDKCWNFHRHPHSTTFVCDSSSKALGPARVFFIPDEAAFQELCAFAPRSARRLRNSTATFRYSIRGLSQSH